MIGFTDGSETNTLHVPNAAKEKVGFSKVYFYVSVVLEAVTKQH